MTKKILLMGEPMGLFIAQEEGPLDCVDSYRFAVAGAEYNVAVGICRLGHQASYITKLGNDPFGKRIARGMAHNGIDTTGVTWSDSHRTGFMLKSKVTQGDPEIFYFRKGSAASTMTTEDAERIHLEGCGNLHITGIMPAIAPNCMQAVKRLMERAREAGLYISFDPNLRPSLWPDTQTMVAAMHELAAKADLVLPGIGEGELLTGSTQPQAIADFYLKLGASAVVVKLGAQGAFACDGRQSVTVPGFAVPKVVDTVGAGDGFAVGVLSACMEGRSLEEATRRGNAIGAMQVMCVGDNEGLPTRSQLAAFMKQEVLA